MINSYEFLKRCIRVILEWNWSLGVIIEAIKNRVMKSNPKNQFKLSLLDQIEHFKYSWPQVETLRSTSNVWTRADTALPSIRSKNPCPTMRKSYLCITTSSQGRSTPATSNADVPVGKNRTKQTAWGAWCQNAAENTVVRPKAIYLQPTLRSVKWRQTSP